MPRDTRKKVLILGSTAPEVAKTLISIHASGKDNIELLGYLDDDRSRWGIRFFGQHVLGGTELLSCEHSDAWVVNNVASTMCGRRRVWHKLDSLGVNSYTLVHPWIDTAQAEIGRGSVVQDGVILSPGARIGRHCLINMGAIVAHESVVEDVCFLGPGAILNGRVHIKEASFLGAGCIILPNIVVGEGSIVGAGAVVTSDVPPYSIVVGCPARVIKQHIPGGGLSNAHLLSNVLYPEG
jgi:sugar O-acyltransferase (sialic acid O-acetyltransferase NeuD family)